MEIISITGTKGKTTITRALSYVINKTGENTLRVDTDGYYINEKIKGTIEESKQIFSLVPTVCPGKYLITMKKFYPNFTAVLETALGSSAEPGLGYGLHNIGVFSNVLEDHLGATPRLKKRSDIAKAKNFIFSRIDVGGCLVFNADDKLVCSQLKIIPSHRKPTFLPIGFNFKSFNLKNHLENKGEFITIEDFFIVIKSKNTTKKILDSRKIHWTFDGIFKPSLYNLMLIIGVLYFHYKKEIPKKTLEILKNYQLEEFGGRLTLFKNKVGIKILLDYAHEKYSLIEIGKLAEKLKEKKSNKTIGIVRLAPDRTNKMIFETGQAISNFFEIIFVYDKIDGINRKVYQGKKSNLKRVIGEVSKIFFDGIISKKTNKKAERIIVEEKAIQKASEISHKGDVVVIICGDNHKKTVGYIKKYFKASLLN